MRAKAPDKGRTEHRSNVDFATINPLIGDDIFINKIAQLDYALEKTYKPLMQVDHTLIWRKK